MEVSQQDDHITHAVIGRHQAQSMGVSDSAALMHILSSALYTHPKLAAVREPVCNAWDAHITAGKTDLPIEITLTNNLLTIQDFGPGIPDEKIVPIYGIYGDSTKREDSDVTGGFGLGSKAPFAYVDNFEVTSCHAGVKTIYRMTKSSMEKGGRPSIVQIVSMPTDETGVKVVINIQERDVSDFKTVINEVIALGEIKANFNGELVPVLPLLDSPTGYIINSFTGTLTNRINIRYGNVTYPIPKSEAYLEEWTVVNDGLRALWDRANIIFYAEPNSISIAPSREALILTEGTVATIKQLLVKFRMEDLADGMLVRRIKNAEHLNKVINSEPPIEEIIKLAEVPNLPRSSEWQAENHWSGAFAYTVRKASVAYAMINNHESYSREEVMIKRLHKMLREAKGKDGDSSKVKFIRDIIKCHRSAPNDTRARDNRRYNYTPGTTTVLHRHVVKPLRDLIDSGSHLTMDRLSFYSANYDWRTGEHMTTVRSLRAGGLGCLSAFLGRRVLIAPNKTAIANHFRHMRYSTDDTHGWIVYTCPIHQKSREAVDKAFRDAGYDVTNVMPEPKVKEVDPNFVPAPRKKARPKRKGYLSLASSLWDSNFLLTTARSSKMPEILDPVAYTILYNKGQWPGTLRGFNKEMSHVINDVLGTKVAVVTVVQAEKLSKLGVPELSIYVRKYVDDTLSSSKEFPRYLAFGRHFQGNRIIKGICSHPTLLKELGLRYYVSPETETLLQFFIGEYALDRSDLPKCYDLLGKVKTSPDVKIIQDKLNNSDWNKYVNANQIGAAMRAYPEGSKELEIPYFLIKKILS